jgi:glutathione S-transferase
MPADVVYARARQDVDAISDQLGANDFFMGPNPTSIDAAVSSMLRHIIDAPFNFDTRDYAASKQTLRNYLGRMKERFDI